MFENKILFKNSLFKASYEIPFYISELEFDNVVFEQFPKFPEALKKLNIKDCRTVNLKSLDIKLNDGLEELTISLCSSIIMKSIQSFPPSLKYLKLRKVGGDHLCEFPEGLETLILTRDCFNHYPYKFPNSLKNLEIYESSWKLLPPFPKNIETLYIWGMYAKDLPPNLPKGYTLRDFFIYE